MLTSVTVVDTLQDLASGAGGDACCLLLESGTETGRSVVHLHFRQCGQQEA